MNPLTRIWWPRLAIPFLVAAIMTACGQRTQSASAPQKQHKHPGVVSALGRVTPGRAVISVAAQPGSRILKLEVTDGQKVKAGTPLAYLDSYTLRLAERDGAQTAVDEAKERVDTETAYAQALVGQSQEAVRLLELAVDHQRKELNRLQSLLTTKTIQQQQFDEQKFTVQSREVELAKSQAELHSAEAALNRIRSTVGLRSTEAHLKAAEAQLELTIVRAPIDGEVLKVMTYPGEKIGDAPILKMGDTANMNVIAEVYESDVAAVKVGQRAVITADAIDEPVEGVVYEVSGIIQKNDVLDIDPRADKDTRVVEVRVKLKNSAAVAQLSQLEVSVRIDTTGAGAASQASLP